MYMKILLIKSYEKCDKYIKILNEDILFKMKLNEEKIRELQSYGINNLVYSNNENIGKNNDSIVKITKNKDELTIFI